MVKHRAVERTLMNLIQACIDIAQHIRSSKDLSPSGTGRKEIRALGDEVIISNETQAHMEETVGLRNILAHRYGDVDHEIVYSVLHDDIHWFERFQQELAQWSKKSLS